MSGAAMDRSRGRAPETGGFADVGGFFSGEVDELSLSLRPAVEADVAAVAAAGSGGTCGPAAIPPPPYDPD